MARYRNALPQLGSDLFLTDGGIETTLIFHEGLDLPHFAAFDLLRTDAGTEALRRYFATYAALATEFDTGLVLESATWRANPDWGERLGYGVRDLADANRRAVELLVELRLDAEQRTSGSVVISGCVGPRGDGYVVGDAMSAAEARRYHQQQIDTFADTGADMVTAITMTYVEEAVGLARAADAAAMPVAISFTVETDGRLPSGTSLGEAIEAVDEATMAYPSYYMINCAHPTHFRDVLDPGAAWPRRIGGIRANASRMSHAQLDEARELDTGDPAELGRDYVQLMTILPNLTVVGGCCGTDHRHIGEIGRACSSLFATTASSGPTTPSGRRAGS